MIGLRSSPSKSAICIFRFQVDGGAVAVSPSLRAFLCEPNAAGYIQLTSLGVQESRKILVTAAPVLKDRLRRV